MAASLAQLNAYFENNSYAEGYEPSQADLTILSSLKEPTQNLPHLLRWFKHMQSFDAQERKKFASKKLSGELSKLLSAGGGAAPPAASNEDDDDDVDLFGSCDEDDAEAEKIKQQRVEAYAAKKSKKPALIAKSAIILDVKPWDDETDMNMMEKLVKEITMDGLVWGASKFVPVGYGIKKLQIMCVVEDDKVSIDDLTEKIEALEDCVQSVDIAAFNKV